MANASAQRAPAKSHESERRTVRVAQKVVEVARQQALGYCSYEQHRNS